jgi:HEAT repeat protein
MKRWISPVRARLVLVLAVGLGPALTAGVHAYAEEHEDETPAEQLARVKKATLARMAVDPASLVNVTGRDLPASPDVLALGRRGVGALARCLADNTDEGMRRTCATMLGRIGDKRGLPALQAALDDWEPLVRLEVVSALERMPDPSSVAPLMRLFGRKDEDPKNRAAVLRALGAHAQKKGIALLRSVLAAKDDPDVLKPTAFGALWRSRHAMSRDTLVNDVADALGGSNDDLLVSAILAAAELRSPKLTAPLVPLLDHPNANVRNKATYALGLIGDKAATKSLLAKLPSVRDGRMLNNISFALERLDRDAFYASVRGLVQHKQAIIRLNAAFVLGDVRRPEGLAMLEHALDDPSDLVKSSAVAALGKIGDPRELPRLEKLVKDSNPALREEAALAVLGIAGKARADVVYDALFAGKRDSPVKQRAALALGEIGDTRVRDYLLDCLESKACSEGEVDRYVRTDKDASVGGRLLLAWARGRGDLTDVVGELRPAGALPIAAAAMDAALGGPGRATAEHALDLAGALGDAATRERLSRRRATPAPAMADPWVSVHALAALARLGDRSAESALLGKMDEIAAAWLPRFAHVVGRIEEADVHVRMTPELARREAGGDPDVALAAAAIRLAWDPEAGIVRLLEGLAAPGSHERDLADRYLVRARAPKVTWLLRAAYARETRADVKDRLRGLLDRRPVG